MPDDHVDSGGPAGAPEERASADPPPRLRPAVALALSVGLIALGVFRPAGDDDEAAAPRVPMHLIGGALATAAVLGVAATFPRSASTARGPSDAPGRGAAR